jgi:hypothetical protein
VSARAFMSCGGSCGTKNILRYAEAQFDSVQGGRANLGLEQRNADDELNSLKGDLGRLRPGLRLHSHSDRTHVHAPTITGISESLRLIIIIFSLSPFALLDLSFTLDDNTLTTRPISTPYLLVTNHIQHLSKHSTMICFSTYSITAT